jgi:7-keto-8-aminopelargonate synthetase-like enzyme
VSAAQSEEDEDTEPLSAKMARLREEAARKNVTPQNRNNILECYHTTTSYYRHTHKKKTATNFSSHNFLVIHQEGKIMNKD